jgi:hypothetical protein
MTCRKRVLLGGFAFFYLASLLLMFIWTGSNRRAAAERELESTGITAIYDRYQRGYILNASSNAFDDEAFLRSMGAIKAIPCIIELHLAGTKITSAHVRDLHDVQDLRCLVLSDTRVGDDCSDEIKKIKGLEELWIGGTGISDAGLLEIARSADLKLIRLDRYTKNSQDGLVTDAGVMAAKQVNTKLSVARGSGWQ